MHTSRKLHLTYYLATCTKFVVAGFCVVFGVLLMLVVIMLLRVFTDFWLGRWINDGNGNSVRNNTNFLFKSFTVFLYQNECKAITGCIQESTLILTLQSGVLIKGDLKSNCDSSYT